LGTKKLRLEKIALRYILISIIIYLLKRSGGYNENIVREYKLYLDQSEFGKRLDKQMREEIDNYLSNRKTIDELMEENFPEPEFKIE